MCAGGRGPGGGRGMVSCTKRERWLGFRCTGGTRVDDGADPRVTDRIDGDGALTASGGGGRREGGGSDFVAVRRE